MLLMGMTVGETFGLKSPKGRFGIEIELEGENLPDLVLPPANKLWSAKGDGSLRHGMEYVSLPVSSPRDTVNVLADYLNTVGAVVNNSYRCSTHIHYNFIDKTWKDVIGTVIAWQIIEPLFLKQLPGRDGSIFCMSAYDTGDMPLNFGRFCDELNRQFKHVGYEAVCRQKYSSLNLTRLRDLGTLEFRVFPPSIDGKEVRKWCTWLDNLVALVEKTDSENFAKFILEAEKRPEDFVTAIFGELPVSGPELGAWVDLGCKTAYELVRIFNTEKKKKVRVKKVKETIPAGWMDAAPGMVVMDDIFAVPQPRLENDF
jgi:hypothetical protein